MAERKLTGRQRLFTREYLVDLNATKAAIRAGYSPRSAGQRGWALRRHPEVAARIEAAMEDRAEAVGITAERVLCELARLGFANIRDFVSGEGEGVAWLDLSALTREQAAAVTAVEVDERGGGRRVKIKLADKSRNLELIGRHLGLFPRPPAAKKADGKPDAEEAPPCEPLSDLEFAQRILSLAASAEKARDEGEMPPALPANSGFPPSPRPSPIKGEGEFSAANRKPSPLRGRGFG